MNKYFILVAVVILIIGGGAIYRIWLLPEELVPVVSGRTLEITITARKNQWRFDPETIEITRGDRVVATVVNEDDYDHGIAIDAFGVSQRLPANSTIRVEFVATQLGDFPFYCSVPCGEGMVAGKKRGHFDQVGTLRVRDAVSATQ